MGLVTDWFELTYHIKIGNLEASLCVDSLDGLERTLKCLGSDIRNMQSVTNWMCLDTLVKNLTPLIKIISAHRVTVMYLTMMVAGRMLTLSTTWSVE